MDDTKNRDTTQERPNGNYIRLYRSLKEWEWVEKPFIGWAFIHLLLQANFKDLPFEGRIIKRGQCVISAEKFGKSIGLTRQQTRTALDKLKSTNEITIEATSKYTLITVVNYNTYQVTSDDCNQPSNQHRNQRVTNEQPASNHKRKNDKNDKKDKNISNPSLDGVPPDHLSPKANLVRLDDYYIWLTPQDKDKLLRQWRGDNEGAEDRLAHWAEQITRWAKRKWPAFRQYPNHYDMILDWDRKQQETSTWFKHETKGWGWYRDR